MKKIVPFIAAGSAACFLIAGCGTAKESFIVDSEDNVIKIISENSDGTEATGTLTVKENDYVIFSPDLDSGSVEVKFISDTGYDESSLSSLVKADAVYEGTYSGMVLNNETIAPGDYYVLLTSRKASGTMLITTENKDEFEKQNEELKKKLEDLNIELENFMKQ